MKPCRDQHSSEPVPLDQGRGSRPGVKPGLFPLFVIMAALGFGAGHGFATQGVWCLAPLIWLRFAMCAPNGQFYGSHEVKVLVIQCLSLCLLMWSWPARGTAFFLSVGLIAGLPPFHLFRMKNSWDRAFDLFFLCWGVSAFCLGPASARLGAAAVFTSMALIRFCLRPRRIFSWPSWGLGGLAICLATTVVTPWALLGACVLLCFLAVARDGITEPSDWLENGVDRYGVQPLAMLCGSTYRLVEITFFEGSLVLLRSVLAGLKAKALQVIRSASGAGRG